MVAGFTSPGHSALIAGSQALCPFRGNLLQLPGSYYVTVSHTGRFFLGVWRRYGTSEGKEPLREAIANTFYPNMRASNEIFVSDGSKCDIGRLQMMFGGAHSVSVQDPSYPVYLDTSVMMGMTGQYSGEQRCCGGGCGRQGGPRAPALSLCQAPLGRCPAPAD